MPRATQITDPLLAHGEGPVWWPDGHLRCVDLLAGDVIDVLGGEIQRTHVSAVAAVVRPRRTGGSVTAVERGILLQGADGSVEGRLELWADPSVRMNDGGCDPHGRFYCGSMAVDESPGRGRLYRFDDADSATVVVDNVTISNGFAFTPNGQMAYYVDSATRRVDVFDFSADGELVNRRAHIVLNREDGEPDGLVVDGEGGIWVAVWGAGEVRHYSPSGHLDEVVTVPGVPQVSACTLGGPGMDTLYITTSRLRIPETEAGEAGALFEFAGVPAGTPVAMANL